MGTAIPVPTTVAPEGTSETPATPSSASDLTVEETPTVAPAPVTVPVEGLPQTTIIVGIIGAIAIIAGIFLVRRWWIQRQNPALFKKYD